ESNSNVFFISFILFFALEKAYSENLVSLVFSSSSGHNQTLVSQRQVILPSLDKRYSISIIQASRFALLGATRFSALFDNGIISVLFFSFCESSSWVSASHSDFQPSEVRYRKTDAISFLLFLLST